MSFLDNLMGGGDDRRSQYQDFVNRYDQGAPYDGISEDEAFNNYQQVAGRIPPDVYQQSAQEAFSRMAPQERMQFGQYLQQQATSQGLPFQDLDRDGRDDRYQDPAYLAQLTGQMEQQQPGVLGQLLGGGGGGPLGGGGGLLGGGGGRMMGNLLGGGGGGLMGGGGGGGMLANPLAKAALGGIAAMAFKRMMGGR